MLENTKTPHNLEAASNYNTFQIYVFIKCVYITL